MRAVGAISALVALASLASAAPLACGARQYISGAVCKPCPLTMMSCTSATSALSCARGRYLNADKQCVLARECPQNTFADSSKSTCTKCYVKDAATCSDATVSGTTSCTTGCLYSKNCLPAVRLPVGLYCPNHVATACPDSHAKDCDDAGKSTVCKASFRLQYDDTCVQCIGDEQWDSDMRRCMIYCRAGSLLTGADGTVTVERATFPDMTTRTCQQLCNDEGALTCDLTGVSQDCIDGWNLSTDNVCVKCADGETFDADSKTCKAAITTCLNAHYITTGYTTPNPDLIANWPPWEDIPEWLTEPQPIQEVAAATYLDPTTNQCKTCSGWNVYSCDQQGKTTVCYDSYLYDGSCTHNCNGNPGNIARGIGTPADANGQPFSWFGICLGHV
ncbi:Extracellular matrix protein fras1 [Rhodotorula kratochvilovae]